MRRSGIVGALLVLPAAAGAANAGVADPLPELLWHHDLGG
jgi:hypothetical protein